MNNNQNKQSSRVAIDIWVPYAEVKNIISFITLGRSEKVLVGIKRSLNEKFAAEGSLVKLEMVFRDDGKPSMSFKTEVERYRVTRFVLDPDKDSRVTAELKRKALEKAMEIMR